ncbi:rbcL ribulose bisphosphate carboxylase, large subunit (EC 4.1.1.39) [Pyrococcus abyssi GE5]|uniref:Ribulose bisphosphate carboxylase n=2 Tax=Pyrococcus abyssi TaxID=29292 RepID=RBL_PYRAB|nr:RecName: Full=Ribulose bisphosphate carboxylase; Short=RuBisCO [Pyrococcus abyssi GE5]CAB50122.1 rbcL ribulose bisphosphate carboxylase, large subunit (EC 4.1.1.39) [Pyrococcus abyssi GE5]CCE70647.1 TPA: ribulose bisophosphate carboxylase [Pyrococcus abyssi GE5]
MVSSMKVEWYLDFVDLNYEPGRDELIVEYYFEPNGVSPEEAAGRIASESSIGTWTTLWKLPEMAKRSMAKVFYLEKHGEGYIAKIAYPLTLFEEGSLVQLFSAIAGNVFGMKALKNLRLLDFHPPYEYLRHFKGPQFGVKGIREFMGIKDRPLTATVPKPKMGWSVEEYAEIAYELWSGGIDLLKDDENFTSFPFNRFEERVKKLYRVRDRVEAETGETKEYLINITGPVNVMEKRAELVANEGGQYVMIDIVVAGWSALQYMREVTEDLGLAIHAHRAMHAAFTRNPKHGITMFALAKAARMIGVDQIHTGTAVGKMAGDYEEIKKINDFLLSKWEHIRPVFPVASGGLHPGLMPELIRLFGKDLVIQAGGGVMGHPDGPRAGAKALRDAIDAAIEGLDLEEKAKSSPELKKALDKWGYLKPK